MLKSCLFIYRFRVKKNNLPLLSWLQVSITFFFSLLENILLISYQKNIMWDKNLLNLMMYMICIMNLLG